MNDLISSVLYGTKDGQPCYSNTDLYSVAQYAYSQLSKPNSSDTLKSLCADLLRYGAKAQIYKGYRTDALADSRMTATHKGYLTDLNTVTFGDTSLELAFNPNPAVAWEGKALDLNSKVIVKFIFTISDPTIKAEDLSLHVTFENYKGETVTKIVEGAELYNAAYGYYAFSFDGLLAAELRCVMNAVIYNGETRLSNTSYYSVDTYGNGRKTELLDLCKALIAYSDTALAFFNK